MDDPLTTCELDRSDADLEVLSMNDPSTTCELG